MNKIFFISDCHFGLQNKQHEREREFRLFSFFDEIQHEAEKIFILGDLFDYWFEYKHVVPKGFHRILTRLEGLTSAGIEVHLVVGNHDFWVGKRFTEETGVHVYYDPVSLILNDKRFYLHHGDGLNEGDKGYRVLRSILRNRTNIFLYRLLHPDLGIGLARKSSQASRENHSENGLPRERDALRAFAMKKLAEGFDYVLMGHDHIPEQFSTDGRQYINLGDWITHNSYAVFDGDEVKLMKWKTTKETLVYNERKL
jgi:UDP-2,3-diacylglucosamine hydrolase